MADIIHLYPKTSCWIGNCQQEYPVTNTPGNIIKTNLSVENCTVSPYYDCYYSAELKQRPQPYVSSPENAPTNWYQLNPQVYTSKLSPDFRELKCDTPNYCSSPVYTSLDPRLFDSPRANSLGLDRPPANGDVRLKDVYNEEYTDYGIGFTPYNQIKDGQITYYVDKTIAGPFYKPVFSEPAKEVLSLYKDPMGAMKPNANRIPLINTENPTVTTPVQYPYCLSFLQDTQSHREDLMSYQQRKHNQEKWTVRWE